VIATVLLAAFAGSASWAIIAKALTGMGALDALACSPCCRSGCERGHLGLVHYHPNRVRTCLTRAWIENRAGQIRVIIGIARPFGERMTVWCWPATSCADIEAARELLGAACLPAETVVSRSS
jgi:hypothetical protein